MGDIARRMGKGAVLRLWNLMSKRVGERDLLVGR